EGVDLVGARRDRLLAGGGLLGFRGGGAAGLCRLGLRGFQRRACSLRRNLDAGDAAGFTFVEQHVVVLVADDQRPLGAEERFVALVERVRLDRREGAGDAVGVLERREDVV